MKQGCLIEHKVLSKALEESDQRQKKDYDKLHTGMYSSLSQHIHKQCVITHYIMPIDYTALSEGKAGSSA